MINRAEIIEMVQKNYNRLSKIHSYKDALDYIREMGICNRHAQASFVWRHVKVLKEPKWEGHTFFGPNSFGKQIPWFGR